MTRKPKRVGQQKKQRRMTFTVSVDEHGLPVVKFVAAQSADTGERPAVTLARLLRTPGGER